MITLAHDTELLMARGIGWTLKRNKKEIQMKIRYTVIHELEVKDEWYNEGDDIVAIEKENAEDVLLSALENGKATIEVEVVDES